MFACLVRFVVGWAFMASAAALAADLRIVSATQSAPGQLVVQVAVTGNEPIKASDFELSFPNGVKTLAVSLKEAAAPADSRSLLLCIDTSGSMGPAVPVMRQVLASVLAGPDRPNALPFRTSITAFDTRSQVLLPFSSDKAAVGAGVSRLRLDANPAGRTRLYDAVLGGMERIRSETRSARHLIVVSDGKDEGSISSASDLLKVILRESPTTVVDAIAFGALSTENADSLRSLAGASASGQFVDAGTDPKLLAKALEGLTRLAVSPRLLELGFRYSAAENAPQTQKGVRLTLKLGGADLTGLELPTAVSPAATSPAAPVASSSGSAGPDPGPDTRITWWPWVAGGAVALVLSFLLYLLLKRPSVDIDLPAGEQDSGGAGLPRTTIRPVSPPTAPAMPPAPPIGRKQGDRKQTGVAYYWPVPGQGVVAHLHGLSGNAREQHYLIDQEEVSVGSAPENDIVLANDEFVSGRHGAFRAVAHSLYVVDLDSRNGTFVNGKAFKSGTQALIPGDVIQFGLTAMEVVAVGESPRQSPGGFEPVVP